MSKSYTPAVWVIAIVGLWDFRLLITKISYLSQNSVRNSIRGRFSSVHFSRSVVSDSLRPHESQHTRPPGHHRLLEFTQTHVHWVSDAIQPSHPLSSLSPPAPNPSQHQGLFQWVSSSHEVAKLQEFSRQPQSFQWIFRIDFLSDWLVGSCSVFHKELHTALWWPFEK